MSCGAPLVCTTLAFFAGGGTASSKPKHQSKELSEIRKRVHFDILIHFVSGNSMDKSKKEEPQPVQEFQEGSSPAEQLETTWTVLHW